MQVLLRPALERSWLLPPTLPTLQQLHRQVPPTPQVGLEAAGRWIETQQVADGSASSVCSLTAVHRVKLMLPLVVSCNGCVGLELTEDGVSVFRHGGYGGNNG